MQIDINEPLVWTTKGNVPAKLLATEPQWLETDDYTQLVFVYRLDGEVVREDKYIKFKRGLTFDAVQAS